MTGAAGTLPDLDKPITSGASLNDSERYVVAYYLNNGAAVPSSPMFVDAYDRKARAWKSAAITGGGSQINAAGASMPDDICLGSVSQIRASAESIFVDTHKSVRRVPVDTFPGPQDAQSVVRLVSRALQ
jgi:hypothetical protein